ncbi:hypothetical protein T4B_7930 [Trichinella pseudospiralis]|uniref:Uncharacterized protein n=1 Tax=Trichinella pseudospiralis TaxID=6337 RepID=A0A0V1EVE8_TRIPS|nr:hypothetical protein T4A_5267 [Trichinella pseudospiralis]KRZ32776.1 hypothetical protein T4B_7930 [Trichinella pseudospiralis]KRZ43916.1 hypothetical protein T4C_4940 [Trichinella pseudospiralis]
MYLKKTLLLKTLSRCPLFQLPNSQRSVCAPEQMFNYSTFIHSRLNRHVKRAFVLFHYLNHTRLITTKAQYVCFKQHA